MLRIKVRMLEIVVSILNLVVAQPSAISIRTTPFMSSCIQQSERSQPAFSCNLRLPMSLTDPTVECVHIDSIHVSVGNQGGPQTSPQRTRHTRCTLSTAVQEQKRPSVTKETITDCNEPEKRKSLDAPPPCQCNLARRTESFSVRPFTTKRSAS